MINSYNFINSLTEKGYSSFYGVPDSILSSFSKSLYFDFNHINHFITANEGSALAMSIGYQLTHDKVPIVYLQNSGLGNLINPYLSLTNKYVYDIPTLFIIGWRGEPGTKDEPQHMFQGKITLNLLDLLEIDYAILDSETNFEEVIEQAVQCNKQNKSFVILVKKNTFKNDKRNFPSKKSTISRDEALESLIKIEQINNLYISTTGKLSRELDSIREGKNSKPSDFYLVGGMGHTFSVSYSLAHENPDKVIICLDGDGSFLMHLGSVGLVASNPLENYIHILFNNSSHQSVGGQPTYIDNLDLEQLSNSLGFKSFLNINKIEDLDSKIYKLERPAFINIVINTDEKPNLSRPKNTPVKNKESFKSSIQK